MKYSAVEIFAPIMKVNIPVFEKYGKPIPVRLQNKVVKSKEHYNFFAKCAVLSNNRDMSIGVLLTHETGDPMSIT